MAISGRYEGTADNGNDVLHLRVDVDTDGNPSLVTNRVSGDLFTQVPDSRDPLRFHRGSWVATSVTHTPSTNGNSGTIQGNVLFRADGGTGRLLLTLAANGIDVSVQLTFPDTSIQLYSCSKVSKLFRDVTLDVSVSEVAFREADYDPRRVQPPEGFQTRPLTFENALADAGIDLSRSVAIRNIDDAAEEEFPGWNDDSLNDAIENHFLHDAPPAKQRPAWELWALLGKLHQSGPARVGGVMFDTRDLNRQGFAVFKHHDWFNPLPAPGAQPANPREAMALRKYLFTWVHEIGHAFNLPHCWQRTADATSTALTWTNDDLKFPPQNGDGFWDRFDFAFDQHDLIHLRHGDLRQVIPGGADFTTGRELDALDPKALKTNGGESQPVPQLELRLRCRSSFEHMAPIRVEARVLNLSGEAQRIRTNLSPEDGGLTVLIQRYGEKRPTVYAPLVCRLCPPQLKTLGPAGSVPDGNDRHSEELDLTYGRQGFSFITPGMYSVWAIYSGVTGETVVSNDLTINVNKPATRDDESRSQNFFTRDVGKTLQLGGSRSEFLEKGFALLTEMADRHAGSAMGTELAASIMRGFAEPLWSVREGRLRRLYQGDRRRALESTKQAVEFLAAQRDKIFNLPHRRLVQARAMCHDQEGDVAAAASELTDLYTNLSRRDVRTTVLEDVSRERDKYLNKR
jgi:hypothetical protein